MEQLLWQVRNFSSSRIYCKCVCVCVHARALEYTSKYACLHTPMLLVFDKGHEIFYMKWNSFFFYRLVIYAVFFYIIWCFVFSYYLWHIHVHICRYVLLSVRVYVQACVCLSIHMYVCNIYNIFYSKYHLYLCYNIGI